MTIYRGTANPNATNSELDAKVIIKHPKLDDNERVIIDDDSCDVSSDIYFHLQC